MDENRSEELRRILGKLKRPVDASTSSNPSTMTDSSGGAWRITESQLQIIREQEAVLEKDHEDIRWRRRCIDMIYYDIEKKQKWITTSRDEMSEAQKWIQQTEKNVAVEELKVLNRELSLNRPQAWVDAQKKKYPYQFPEWRIKE